MIGIVLVEKEKKKKHYGGIPLYINEHVQDCNLTQAVDLFFGILTRKFCYNILLKIFQSR
jgi:hypothetical protein